MRIFETGLTRDEYIRTQIQRSEAKFGYCKVSVHDVRRYASILGAHRRREGETGAIGPIVCLGTRNGREIDLFRHQFFGSSLLRSALPWLERRRQSFTSLLPAVDRWGRSSLATMSGESAIGVEVNPHASRSDVWIGSFDEMPAEWTGRFGVVYSNSFDQSEDPRRTAREWLRIVRPGGYVILCFSKNAVPTISDPVGELSLADVRELFAGDIVYYHDRGSLAGYSELMLRVPGRNE